MARHRVLRQLGARASTRTPASASCCTSIRSPAIRRRRRRRSRARRAPSSACAPWRSSGLQTTATLWYLDFDSELIYVGDSGSTEEGPASRRIGVEITNYIYPNPWVAADLDISFSRARFLDVPEGEDFVPGALNRVISAGIGVNPPAGVSSGMFGSFRVRHFGPRPLIEDNSVESRQTSIVNGEIGYKFSERVRLTAEAFNLFDAEVSDIDYFFESRLRDEPAPVEDIHFHAAIPRSARVALKVSF